MFASLDKQQKPLSAQELTTEKSLESLNSHADSFLKEASSSPFELTKTPLEIIQIAQIELKTLKKSIKKDLQQREYEQLFLSYVDHLLKLKSLEVQDSHRLQRLKNSIQKTQLLESDSIDDVISILKKIEKKAQDLNDEDTLTIQQLQDLIFQQKKLEETAKETKDPLKDKKQEIIEKLRTALQSHWYSARLADPLCTFLQEKYIQQKKGFSWKTSLLWGLGIGLAGLFLWPQLKKLLHSLDYSSLEDFAASSPMLSDQAKELLQQPLPSAEHLSHEQLDKVKYQIKKHFEDHMNTHLDHTKFASVFERWRKERAHTLVLKTQKSGYTLKHAHMEGENASFNIMDEAFGILSIPPKALLDLTFQLTDEGVTSWQNLSFDLVVLPSGKAMVNAGLNSLGLFANGVTTFLGSLSLEEYAEYIQSRLSKMNSSSQEAMRALLYRQGGLFWELAGYLGSLVWQFFSLAFLNKESGDIGKLLARQAGIFHSYERELQVLKQLQNSLSWTHVFQGEGKIWITHLETLMKTAQNNAKLFTIAYHAQDLPRLEQLLIEHWYQDILSQLKSESLWKQGNLKWIQAKVGNLIQWTMNNACNSAADDLGKIKKFLAKKFTFPWMKTPFETQLLKDLRGYTYLQEKLLQKTDSFYPLKKVYLSFAKGNKLANVVEYADGVKLSLKNVAEAKEFFDNVKTIGRHSPQLLKTLFKGFPLLMVGKEMIEKMADPHTTDSMTKILRDGLMYLTPIVGPICLIHEGITYKNGEFVSLGSVGIGMGMFAVDSFFLIKDVSKAMVGMKWFAKGAAVLKSSLKYFFSPLKDAAEFAKLPFRWAYLTMKMTKDGVRVFQQGNAKMFTKLFASFTGKLVALAGLSYLGYQAYSLYSDDPTEQKQITEIQNMSPAEREKFIQQQRPHLSADEQLLFIKLAIAQRLNISNLDALKVEKKDHIIHVTLATLVNKYDLLQAKADMCILLRSLFKDPHLDFSYTLDMGEIKEELLGIKKYFFDHASVFQAEAMKEYLLAMGYTEKEVYEQMKIVVKLENLPFASPPIS